MTLLLQIIVFSIIGVIIGKAIDDIRDRLARIEKALRRMGY